MANVFSTNTKKILHSLGCVIDGAYLWAGADKGIETEMQGKNNGAKVYYTISSFGDAQIDALAMSSGVVDGSKFAATAQNVSQRDVAVDIYDARIMLTTNAFERMITSMGEVKAHINVGQKLAKKAINQVMPGDIASIGNVFVGKDYKPYQLAGAYLKSYTEGKLYGFMDWQAWGVLTSQGQQAVPCNLARPEFGNNLVGKWSLIDELRVIPDIPTVDLKFCSGTAAAATKDVEATVTNGLTVTANVAAGNYLIQVPGIYNTDANGSKAGLYTFKLAVTASTGSVKVDIPAGVMIEAAVSGAAIKSLVSSTEEGTYAGCIIRAEGAQCFGSANDVSCKSAKYAKESYEGFTVHTNEDSSVANFTDYKRWDLVTASKLVEPRAAALVYFKI